MKMVIDYPESLPDLLQESPAELEKEMRTALAAKLFELKRIPSGIAAKLVGISRVDFLMQLHEYGVPAIDFEEDEIYRDTGNV